MIISGLLDRKTNYKVCVGSYHHNILMSDGSVHNAYVYHDKKNMAQHRIATADPLNANVTDMNGTFFWITYYSDSSQAVFKDALATHIYGQLKLKLDTSGNNPSWIEGVTKHNLERINMTIGKSGAGMTIELLPNHTIKCTMKDNDGSCGYQGKPKNGTTSEQVYLLQAFLKGKYQIFVQKYNYIMVADLFKCDRRSK